MTFKVGEKVRVCATKPSASEIRGVGWNSYMTETLGKVGVVKEVYGANTYGVKVNDGIWAYKGSWLTLIPSTEIFAIIEDGRVPRVYIDKAKAQRRARYSGGRMVPLSEVAKHL